jgi:hypothetical protein
VSRIPLSCVLGAALVAALLVAGQRVGLAVTVVLLAAIAAGVSAARERVDRPALVLAVALALQPTLRDAGWVVAACSAGALVAGAAAVVRPAAWTTLATVVVTPLRLVGGAALLGRTARSSVPAVAGAPWAAVGRGVGLAALLVGGFGALFASADPAFAAATEDLFDVGVDPDAWVPRLGLGALAATTAAALARAAAVRSGTTTARGRTPGRTETLIALGALVVLFCAFVVVQAPVLFGGADHVAVTAELGYGDYARAGFLQLLAVATLTLAVVGVAARHRDRTVRGLLAALCVLTLVVLLSAHLRLRLVEDVYGLTRVRYAGHAVLLWLAAVLAVVLLAGARAGVARRAPRVVLLLGLAGLVAFSLSNPDGRIAGSVVARAAGGGAVDTGYAQGLSADALPRLRALPAARGGATVRARIRARLARPDGLPGLNLSRWAAR